MDYNAIYNIDASKYQATEKMNELDNNIEQVDEKETFNIAAPPSFEINNEPVKEEVVEEPEPVIPEIRPEDMVSIDIDEPDVLPVGSVKVDNSWESNQELISDFLTHSMTFNDDKQESDLSSNTMNNININNKPNNENKFSLNDLMNTKSNNSQLNQGIESNNQNAPVVQVQQPNQDVNNNIQNIQMMQVQQSNQDINNNIQNMSTTQVPQQSQSVSFNQSSGLLRENEDSRALENSMKQRPTSKFINDEEDKYTLPKAEPVVLQKPTDPSLIANPMSIFGGNVGSIRPTANEAMKMDINPMNQINNNQVQQQSQFNNEMQGMTMNNQMMQQPTQVFNAGINNQMQQQNTEPRQAIGKCPQCGFIVKEGQPSCVVCGYKF